MPLKKYKLQLNGDQKEVDVPDECKKSALKFEEYFLKVFNKTLNDHETLELTMMDDAEFEEAFNINAFNSDDESLTFIGKIKKRKLKGVKQINSIHDSSDYGLLFSNFIEGGEEGGQMSENEIAEPAPAPPREYRKLYIYRWIFVFNIINT